MADERLDLRALIHAAGIPDYELARRIGVETGFIRRAKKGYPIAASKAELLLSELSKEHGRLIRPQDVKDLVLC